MQDPEEAMVDFPFELEGDGAKKQREGPGVSVQGLGFRDIGLVFVVLVVLSS